MACRCKPDNRAAAIRQWKGPASRRRFRWRRRCTIVRVRSARRAGHSYPESTGRIELSHLQETRVEWEFGMYDEPDDLQVANPTVVVLTATRDPYQAA